MQVYPARRLERAAPGPDAAKAGENKYDRYYETTWTLTASGPRSPSLTSKVTA
jgi:hypothetical protein